MLFKNPDGIGVILSALNITNTIIGGGILELPYVMKNWGILLTIVFLFFTYILTLLSLVLLLNVSKIANINDLNSLARKAFGGFGSFVVDWSVFTYNFGICVGYLIIFQDCVGKIEIELDYDNE